jgi:hypothetical protein
MRTSGKYVTGLLAAAVFGVAAHAQAPAPALGYGDAAAIAAAATKQNGATPYIGKSFQITADFAHMDHHDDYAAGQRPDNARSFEVLLDPAPNWPHNVANIYVSCLLPATHPYSALADKYKLGDDPPEFSGTFALSGTIADLDYDESHAAQIDLAPGCTVTKTNKCAVPTSQQSAGAACQ